MKKIVTAVLFILFCFCSNAFASTQLSEILENDKNLDSNLAKQTVEQVFDAIKTALSKGESVQVRNFGTFYIQKRKERKAINPKTRAVIQVPARNYAKFRVSENLKQHLFKVNQESTVSVENNEIPTETKLEELH